MKRAILTGLILAVIVAGCASNANVVQYTETTNYHVQCYNYGFKVYDNLLKNVILKFKYPSSMIDGTLKSEWFQIEDGARVLLPTNCIMVEIKHEP